MDWQLAIARKKKELLAIVAAMQTMMTARLLSRHGRNAVLRILRPAESTLRRLIVIVASTIEIKPVQSASRPLPDFSGFKGEGKKRAPAFRLIDPRKRFDWLKPEKVTSANGPRISAFPFSSSSRPSEARAGTHARGYSSTSVPEETSRNGSRIGFQPSWMTNGEIDTLTRRIEALAHALNTLPKQAKRLIRLMERRKTAPPGPKRVGPIRPGLPPGYRRKHTHEIDDILWDCHGLALDCGWQPP